MGSASTKRQSAFLNLLLDTHVLVWLSIGHPRLSRKLVECLGAADTSTFVSSVTAWEFSDLLNRDRLPLDVSIDALEIDFGFILLDLPAELWRLSAALPDIHRDPVDRMTIAHAIALEMTLVTADKNMRRYPVKSLW